MRAGLLVRTLGTQGGTERFVHGLAAHLVEAGHDVVVYCTAVEQPVAGLEVQLLPFSARGRVGKMTALSRAAQAVLPADHDVLMGFVRAGRPDLYRAGGGSHRAWMARLGRGRLDLPGRAADRLEAGLEDEVLAHARVIVANSELAAADLVAFSGVDAARIRVVRNGVDLERFHPGAGPRLRSGPTALFVGHGWARKGLDTALRALVLVPDLHLVVAGRERHPGRWQRLARRLGVADRVQLRGQVAQPEQLMAGADLFVLPTRYDPSANACLEAMACGLPVVTSATNGACEVLPEPWLTVASADDAPAFADAMERALQSNGLGSRCRAVAETLPAHGAFDKIATLASALTADPAPSASEPA